MTSSCVQVTNLGGGLYQNNLTSTVTSCIFAENSALQAFSGEGGGVYRNGVRGDLTNIYFENNDAALNGGGVFQVRRGRWLENQRCRLTTVFHRVDWYDRTAWPLSRGNWSFAIPDKPSRGDIDTCPSKVSCTVDIIGMVLLSLPTGAVGPRPGEAWLW